MNLLRAVSILVVSIAALAIGAATASADSVVYLKDGNVWLTSPDASRQYQVTFDGGYDSPSQADDGTIVALHDKMLVRLDRSGHQKGDAIAGIGSPGPGGGDVFYGPYEPRVSPDGTKIAYWFGRYSQYYASRCDCYLWHTTVHTTWTHADHFTDPSSESDYTDGTTQPEWLTNDRLLTSYGGFSQNIWTYKIGVGHGNTGSAAQFWFNVHLPDDYGYFDFGDPALSPDGTKLALTDDGDVNTNTRLWVAAVNGPAWVGEPPYTNDYLEDPLPQPPELKCQKDTGKVLNPTWAPDSDRLAFSLDDGVHVWDVPDGLDCSTVRDRLLVAGGSQPDWGPADVDLSQKPSPPPPPGPKPGPGPQPDPHPGPKPGPTPGPSNSLKLSGLALKPASFKAKRGTRVSFTLSAPARLTYKVAGVRGSIAGGGKPGANSLRFKGRIAAR
jgi:hypothetical protein